MNPVGVTKNRIPAIWDAVLLFYANRKKALDRYDSDTNSKNLIISPDSALNHMGIFQNMFLNDKRKKIMKLKMPYVGMT